MKNHKVYLCEKPDQARQVAIAMGGGQNGNGGIIGDSWVVTWAFGHLLTTYAPHEYNEELKKWSWDTLPIIPEKFLFKAKDERSGQQVNKIAKFFEGASEVVISTDPDREGELIAYEILNRLKWTGHTTRLWLTDLSPDGVNTALKAIKPAAETKPLYFAAMARMYADWIVGMNMSRAATLKLAAPGAKPMSVGRVQTPTLALIVDLERKIKGFKSQDYFEISATVSTGSGDLRMKYAPPAENRLIDRAQAEQLRAKAEGYQGPLEVVTEAKRQAPPSLFDLDGIQQEANAKYGWSADKTLKLIQSLYDAQILTYPRTDCVYLPETHKQNIPIIANNFKSIPELAPYLASVAETPVIRTQIYNNSKVGAHHGLVPTNQSVTLSALSSEQVKIYLMVAKRWIAAHLPDMEYLQTSITLTANGTKFRAGGRQVTKAGWKSAYNLEDETDDEDEKSSSDADEQDLPPLTNGQTVRLSSAKLESKKTKPPSRFTEKTLLQAMKNVAAHVDDPAAKKTLKATSGIATPATRANIIETLKAREYVKIQKKQFVPTEIGNALIDAMRSVAPGYASPVMTARWEDVLEEIASGDDKVKGFVAGISTAVKQDILAIKNSNVARLQSSSPASNKTGKSEGKMSQAAKDVLKTATAIKVPFDKKDIAKGLGAKFDPDKKSWVIPAGMDHAPFKAHGFI